MYREAQAVGIILSPGLKADPRLNALVTVATDGVINQRKVVSPIFPAEKSNPYVYLEHFEGIRLYSDADSDERRRRAIFLQVRKMLRWLS